MQQSVVRAQLLGGDPAARRVPLRPPWALPEAAFIERCSGCGDCLPVCPTGILGRGRGRLPVVDFSSGECTFCGACVEACGEGALRREAHAAPWGLVAVVGASCLPRHGVECRSCGDYCAPVAIRFRPRPGALPTPDIDPALCTGCGACVAPCPARAVSVVHPLQESRP